MSSYSEGQTHQLMGALEKAGFTAEDVTKLGQYPDLQAVRGIVRGHAQVTPVDHLIDLSATLLIPQGWSLAEDSEQIQSRAQGTWKWDSAKLTFWFHEEQTQGTISDTDFKQALEGQQVLPVTLLDYLLKPENQYLIPEAWKGQLVFFWGTIYHDPHGYPYVRCLRWNGARWFWFNFLLYRDWHFNYPALVLAS